tara:strand:- start:1237 stop:1488 length:252 start_codon:yes stop_codon:yes gene_type:complete
MTISEDKLKIIKYRSQTLGMRELDVVFAKVASSISQNSDIVLIEELLNLLKEETQYIYSLIFNPIDPVEVKKYKNIYKFIKSL